MVARYSAPLVSIVVPSWQQGRFLDHALASLAAQTHEPVEVIVQDNCSTDETRRWLDAYAAEGFAVVVEEDGGQSDALGRGFQRARGEIFGWLNADDLLMPGAIQRAVAEFQRRPDVDVVYGDAAFVDEGGQFVRYFHELQEPSTELLLNHSDYISQPSAFFRRGAYEEVGGVDRGLEYAMDWDLWCRFARAGLRFQRVEEVLSATRVHASAKTSSGGWSRLREILRVNRRHKTTRLPVAALRELWAGALGGPAGPGTRALARRLVGGGALRPARVCGLDRGGVAEAPEFRLCFPLYSRVRAAVLELEAGALRRAELARRPPASCQGSKGRLRLHWAFPEPLALSSVELRVELAPGSAARLIDFELELEPSGGPAWATAPGRAGPPWAGGRRPRGAAPSGRWRRPAASPGATRSPSSASATPGRAPARCGWCCIRWG